LEAFLAKLLTYLTIFTFLSIEKVTATVLGREGGNKSCKKEPLRIVAINYANILLQTIDEKISLP